MRKPLSQTSNKDHDEQVKKWWENPRNLRWDKFYDQGDSNTFRMLQRQGKVLEHLKYLVLPEKATVLELGFGAGQTAVKLLELGFKYVGIDISQQLCDAASKRCHEYKEKGLAEFKVGNIEKGYEFSDESFDVVIVVGALQYLSNIKTCFQEVHRVLKDHGFFIVCQTNMYGLKNMISPRQFLLRSLYAFLQEEHEIFPHSFKSMLTNTKLKRYFHKFEMTSWMNSKFMMVGHEEKRYDITKKLLSFWRLKNILKHNRFSIGVTDGTPFFWSASGKGENICYAINNFMQKVSDMHVIPYSFAFADNVIIVSKKE